MRDRIMVGLERISRTGLANDVAITVVGGGATGVELAGSLADLRNIALAASYPEIDRARIHVSLVERAPALLTPFHPALGEYTRRQLVKRGVDVRLGAAIREIAPGRVVFTDGSTMASDVTVWAAGVAAPGPVSNWNLPQAAGGRIRIGADLRVAGQQRIFAVGDVALIEDHPLPQLAQPALQMGKHAADQVRRLAQGQPTTPFRYRDKGIMATIGYRSAVVELPRGLRFRGTLAWLAWLALHIITLLGGRNRISALVNMSSRYLTWQRGGGLIVGDGLSAGPAPPGGASAGPASPGGAFAGPDAPGHAAARQVAGLAGDDPPGGGSGAG
jgi:NADH dehydrogenase